MGRHSDGRGSVLAKAVAQRSLLARGSLWVAAGLVAACTAANRGAPDQAGGADIPRATSASALVPVADPTQRLEVPGVSILPPQGDKWFIAVPPTRPEPGSLILVQFTKTLQDQPVARPEDLHTVLASVTVTDLKGARFENAQALRMAVAYALGREPEGSPRRDYRVLSLRTNVEASLDPMCVKYDLETEERGVPRFPDSIFVLAAFGVRCIHPYWPDYLVDVVASQRHLQGQPTQSWKGSD
jgi:hypothetical protein